MTTVSLVLCREGSKYILCPSPFPWREKVNKNYQESGEYCSYFTAVCNFNSKFPNLVAIIRILQQLVSFLLRELNAMTLDELFEIIFSLFLHIAFKLRGRKQMNETEEVNPVLSLQKIRCLLTDFFSVC
jgi:hypothetical protein